MSRHSATEKSEPRGSPQLALVDLAVRTKLLVDSVDAYVLTMPSPVNRQKRCLHPVVRERQTLVNQLQSLLRDLGIQRRHEEGDVASILASLHTQMPTQIPREVSPSRSEKEAPDATDTLTRPSGCQDVSD